MGVRAGQGFGSRKPKRGLCPHCGKRGMTQWRATAYGMLRWCQYCQHSEGQGVFWSAKNSIQRCSIPAPETVVAGGAVDRKATRYLENAMAKTQRLLRVSYSIKDAAEALKAAVPAMRSGFNVNTHADDLAVSADDAQALADLLAERLSIRVAAQQRKRGRRRPS